MIARWIKEGKHESMETGDTLSHDANGAEHPLEGDKDGRIVAPTFGLSINTLQYQPSPIDTHTNTPDKITVALWDIGGQASLRSFWRTYYSPLVHCLIFVIDLSDVHRINESVQWLYKMYKEVNDGNNGKHDRHQSGHRWKQSRSMCGS